MMTSTTTYVYNTYLPSPEAYVTKSKNRLKQNGTSVYLKNNDEFELELFNPKSFSVLAKIKINGNYISNRGLVLKPGQRVFLDRYIDDAKKFLFTTYEIDGGNSAALAAIANNGLVEIEFYDETIFPQVFFNQQSNSGSFGSFGSFGNPIMPYYNSLDNITYTSTFNISSLSSVDTVNTPFRSESLETGRVEKGGNSKTKLTDVNMDFLSYVSSTITWKILPESTQPIQTNELRNYCSGCGYRIRKDSWVFCPSCGNKL